VSESEAWNAEADAWVARVREHAHGHAHAQAYDDVVLELLPPPGPAVDVGCGEGRLTRALRGLGFDITGLDPSESLLEAARAADPGGRYVLGEAGALPFGDGSLALVACVNVLPHVVDLVPAVDEFARVLARGAVLVAAFMHPVAQAGTLDEERNELRVSNYFTPEAHEIPLGHHHVFHQHRTLEQYVRAFLAAGFTLDDLREVPADGGAYPRYLALALTRR